MNLKTLKIVFTGGGTGGHIFPLVAVAREIKRLLPNDTELMYIGPDSKWIRLYLEQEDVEIRPVLAGKLRRYITPKAIVLNIVDAFKLFIGCIQSFILIFSANPDLVFSKGGYGAVPTVIAARIMRIPVFTHESDAVPGLANRIISKMAVQTFVSFPHTEYFNPSKTIRVGNPIRRELFEKHEIKKGGRFNLTGDKPVLWVIGGSQGSQRINELILLILPQLLKKFEVIHQCGVKNLKQVRQEASVVVEQDLIKYYHLYDFLEEQEMREAYYMADLIVGRAGSAIIFEAAALSKALILIPLPESAQDHQFENAYRLAEKGAAVVLEEKNLTTSFFLERISFLIEHEDALEKLRQNISHFAKPNAAKVIAHYLLEYLLI